MASFCSAPTVKVKTFDGMEEWWLTTPAAPAVMAIGTVTELNPEEHITGIVTAREIEYAAANVGVACTNMV